mmetsp:Transcript_53089/g.141491  ORF Transcript_53089/g.141491 Transcript_53089/m.141491 type:complete len:207 (-) Transcript_53089:59-679(-)
MPQAMPAVLLTARQWRTAVTRRTMPTWRASRSVISRSRRPASTNLARLSQAMAPLATWMMSWASRAARSSRTECWRASAERGCRSRPGRLPNYWRNSPTALSFSILVITGLAKDGTPPRFGSTWSASGKSRRRTHSRLRLPPIRRRSPRRSWRSRHRPRRCRTMSRCRARRRTSWPRPWRRGQGSALASRSPCRTGGGSRSLQLAP